MFLNDPFQHRRRARVIPDTFRINHRDGTVGANPEAVDLAAIHQRFGADELQFLESPFQILPGLQPLFFGRAIRLRLIGAEQDVPRIFFEAQRHLRAVEFVVHGGELFRLRRFQRKRRRESWPAGYRARPADRRILPLPPLVASGVPPDGEGDILSPGRKACTFLRVMGFSAIAASNHFVRRAGCPALRQAGGPPPRG